LVLQRNQPFIKRFGLGDAGDNSLLITKIRGFFKKHHSSGVMLLEYASRNKKIRPIKGRISIVQFFIIIRGFIVPDYSINSSLFLKRPLRLLQ
jgi:hypothetical protein